MGKPAFVPYEVPKELAEKALEAIAMAAASGKLRRGMNEATKAIERGITKLVIMAEDVSPEEILMHIPVLCKEKEVPYTYVTSKEELGKASGITVPTSCIAITEVGEGASLLTDITKEVSTLIKE